MGYFRHIADLYDMPQAILPYCVCQRVSPRDHHRQTSPDAIKQACAKGEAGFQVIQVQAQADIRLQKVIAALGVWNPIVEKHDAIFEAQFLGQGYCSIYHLH